MKGILEKLRKFFADKNYVVRDLFLKYMLDISREAEDFREIAMDIFKIGEERRKLNT